MVEKIQAKGGLKMDKIGVFVWQPKNGSIGTKVVPIDSFPRARSAQKIWSQSRNQKKMPRGAGVSPSSGEEKEMYIDIETTSSSAQK